MKWLVVLVACATLALVLHRQLNTRTEPACCLLPNFFGDTPGVQTQPELVQSVEGPGQPRSLTVSRERANESNGATAATTQQRARIGVALIDARTGSPVDVRTLHTQWNGERWSRVHKPRADEQGIVWVDVEPGSVALRARARDERLLVGETAAITLAAGDTRVQELALAEGFELHVTLRSTTGEAARPPGGGPHLYSDPSRHFPIEQAPGANASERRNAALAAVLASGGHFDWPRRDFGGGRTEYFGLAPGQYVLIGNSPFAFDPAIVEVAAGDPQQVEVTWSVADEVALAEFMVELEALQAATRAGVAAPGD